MQRRTSNRSSKRSAGAHALRPAGRKVPEWRTLVLSLALLAAPYTLVAGPSADHHILVNSTADAADSNVNRSTGTLTLRQALSLAARDPENNTIVFDPTVFDQSRAILRLHKPLTFAGVRTGLDVLDASKLTGGLALACSDSQSPVITALSKSRLVIKQVSFRNSAAPAVAVREDAIVQLDNCRIAQSKSHGVVCHDRGRLVMVDCVLTGNAQAGIAVFDHGQLQAQRCRIESSVQSNVLLTDQANGELVGCLLREAGFANLDVAGQAKLAARGVRIGGGPGAGVFVIRQAKVELTGCTISEHKGRGIELQQSAMCVLHEGEISDNQDYGVIAFGSARLEAKGTKVAGNANHGIGLRDRANGHFDQCTFTKNRFSGIGCLDASSGGHVTARRCIFTTNGLRPIYRGPLHLDPLPPIPVRIRGDRVECLTEPNAKVELYFDVRGEALEFHRKMRADGNGRFTVSCREVPKGKVMTASTTARQSTSEFNVIAASRELPILDALLAGTGPFSDDDRPSSLNAGLRRWPSGTHLVLYVDNPPTAAIGTYGRFIAAHIKEWTNGQVTAEWSPKRPTRLARHEVLVSLRYIPLNDPPLEGRGGVAYMQWNRDGFFVPPMRVLLAIDPVPAETCPRVLAHELGHVLGLSHVRAGLLSRMQGSFEPIEGHINDFCPIMTYYDVSALHKLYDPRNPAPATLGSLADIGVLPRDSVLRVAEGRARSDRPTDNSTFSPQPQSAGR